MSKFPCSGCGLCCKHIDKAVANLGEHAAHFPYTWDESGVCEKLKDNKCTVYDTRPLICNVDGWIKEFGIDRDWFYELNMKACEELKQKKPGT